MGDVSKNEITGLWKITVTQNFFVPIGMKTATYFEQPTPQLTTLYDRDGKTPWNVGPRTSCDTATDRTGETESERRGRIV